jgi:hypothetical protein
MVIDRIVVKIDNDLIDFVKNNVEKLFACKIKLRLTFFSINCYNMFCSMNSFVLFAEIILRNFMNLLDLYMLDWKKSKRKN